MSWPTTKTGSPAPWRRTSSSARSACSDQRVVVVARLLGEAEAEAVEGQHRPALGISSSSSRQSYELDGKPCRSSSSGPAPVAPEDVDAAAAEVLVLAPLAPGLDPRR